MLAKANASQVWELALYLPIMSPICTQEQKDLLIRARRTDCTPKRGKNWRIHRGNGQEAAPILPQRTLRSQKRAATLPKNHILPPSNGLCPPAHRTIKDQHGFLVLHVLN